MPARRDDNGDAPYRLARNIAGVGSLILAAAMVIFDYASPEYSLDVIPFALALGTGCVMLGVEAGRQLLGGGDR